MNLDRNEKKFAAFGTGFVILWVFWALLVFTGVTFAVIWLGQQIF